MFRMDSALRIPRTSSFPEHPRHLSPFAVWTAFPSADYYGDSVTLGLAPRGRSRILAPETSERDVGASSVPLSGVIPHRLPAGGLVVQGNPELPSPYMSGVYRQPPDRRCDRGVSLLHAGN